MFTISPSLTRRSLIGTAAAAGAVGMWPAAFAAQGEHTAIRPFRVDIPEQALVNLRRRVVATRWPARETVVGHPRACNWQSSGRSSNTGARATTGARWRRS